MRGRRGSPWYRCLAVSGSLVLGLVGPLAAQSSVPDPVAGEWAVTTLSLLRHSHDRCDGISGRLLYFWRGIGGSQHAQQQALDEYVMRRTSSDMSSARRALDIARGFLPRLSREVDPPTTAALEKLHQLENDLCNVVAQPTLPRDAFESRLGTAVDRIAEQEAVLGRLMVIPPQELEKRLLESIKPYLKSIERAGVAAEREYRAYLDSLREAPKVPTLHDHMVDWHARYVQESGPTKQALARYLQSRQANDSGGIAKACKDLVGEVIPLLETSKALEPPDAGAKEPLLQVYLYIRRLAIACNAGRFGEVDQHWAKIQAWLDASRTVLAKYSLQP